MAKLNTSGFLGACEMGYVEELRSHKAAGGSLTLADDSGQTGYHVTAWANRPESLRYLLEEGAGNIDAVCTGDLPSLKGQTALMLAAQRGHLECLQLLLGGGADASLKDAAGCTAEAFAEHKGHAEVAALLRQHRARARQADGGAQAAETPEAALPAEVLRLREAGKRSPASTSDFLGACEMGYVEELRSHKAAGGSLTLADDSGQTGYHVTAWANRPESLRYLLEEGAGNIDAVFTGDLPSLKGQTALMLAAQRGHLECLQLLLGGGADASLKDAAGCTAEAFAEHKGHAEVAALLRQHRARARQADGGAQAAETPEAALPAEVLRLREANVQLAARADTLQAERNEAMREAASARARMDEETAQLREQIAQLAARADALQAERDEALRAAAAGAAARACPPEGEPDPIPRLAAKLKGTVATKATLQAMGEDISALDAEIADLEARLRRARAELTFAHTRFKREYDKVSVVPITLAAQIIGKIHDFLFLYCHAHGMTSGPELQTAKYFADCLQRQLAARPDGGGGGGDLLAEVRHTAELLWTSNLRFEGMGDHAKEFCSLLNAAIRDDLEELASPTAALTRGINALCLQGRGDAALAFPAGGQVYRGTGFDDAHREFFVADRAYRVPGFLATSFSEAKAREFLHRAQAVGQQAVLWIVRVDPEGQHDPTKRCKHVNFVEHSLVAGESEYLFTAYSIFTVRRVTWGDGGEPHRIELDAASDNSVDAEGGDGRWATPADSERLPLAPWY